VKEEDSLRDLDVNVRVILKCILKEGAGSAWTELIWLRIGTVANSCECGNEEKIRFP
jgi:hypothetical protein